MKPLAALVALMEAFPGATLDQVDDRDMGWHALLYGQNGWEVGPLQGKAPYLSHGVHDFTDDLAQIAAWWDRWPWASIGGRVPSGCVVVDVDPRNGGLEGLERVERETGRLVTRTAVSGRGDGGRHLYFRHPGGKVNAKRLPPGLDLKVKGYCVLPPSLHAVTEQPYRWEDPTALIREMPPVLIDALRPKVHQPPRSPVASARATGESPADWFSARTTFADLLIPHGWEQVDYDGTRWRHPAATSVLSATVKNGCLFVYSPNTPFEVTEPGAPYGYTPFRAWAVLEHGGDLSAAARAAKELRDGRRAA